MSKLEVVDATQMHAFQLAGNLRKEDAAEIDATSSGKGKHVEAILKCLRMSASSSAVYADGELIGVGGLIPRDGGAALGWFLSAEAIEKHWRDFARESKKRLPELISEFSLVYNFIDVRYIKAIRWLLWLGFRTNEVYEMAPNRYHFVKMSIGEA
jgi:hypothetical protein